MLPRRGTPVVVVDLYYPVGSFDEPPGLSGLAHFVEHMLFKGTERFPKGQIDRLVTAAAGQCNAETGEDSTHYWFTFPSDRWELALAIEADRMRHARFDPREVELERRVIGEERSRELNSPQGRLDQNHLAVSYLRHPYRNPILGWPEDAARIGVDDLERFYRRHYRPDGAVLVVVGDVEPERALDRVAAVFGGIPPGQQPVRRRRRRSRASRAGATSTLVEPDGVARGLLGWRTVPRGPPRRRRARRPLRPALVRTAVAALARPGRDLGSGDLGRGRARHGAARRAAPDPARGRSGRIPGRDRALHPRRADRLADSGPTPDELARSRCRLEAAWRWERDDLASPGLRAGPCGALGRLADLARRAPGRDVRERAGTSAAWRPRTSASRA